MPKLPETPYQALLSRHRWLERQLTTVRKQRRAFSEPPDDPELKLNWRPNATATTACLAEERRLRVQLDEVRMAIAERSEEERNAGRVMTDAEKAAALAGLVDRASDDELEVLGMAWLKRLRYRAYVDDDGTLYVKPLGETAPPTLRLVQ